jgi:hypothetical protein
MPRGSHTARRKKMKKKEELSNNNPQEMTVLYDNFCGFWVLRKVSR